jgi:hypothetical protein
VPVQPRTESVRRLVEKRHWLDGGSAVSMLINDLLRFSTAIDWHA